MMSEQNPIIDEYINVLNTKLQEVTNEALVFKARLQLAEKEKASLLNKIEELEEKLNVSGNKAKAVGNSVGGPK